MKYVCVCGYIYDEDLGDEENGIVLARAEVLNHVAMEILGKVNSQEN